MDLFDDPSFYGERQRVLDVIAEAGGVVETAEALDEFADLKWPMNTGKVLGLAVLITGHKH